MQRFPEDMTPDLRDEWKQAKRRDGCTSEEEGTECPGRNALGSSKSSRPH